ncbi:MAG: LysM peptidoglycan-binding domain-containing protein [Chloroflexota bacterium]|nr:LysM peptidoglycan-binding domain-containing protein [Chloroflexota bacterium]
MLKVVGWLAFAAAAILFPLAVFAAYDVTGFSPAEPFRTGFRGIAATVDIHPDTLELRSHGQPITAYIELPQGFDVADIDVSTVRLCLGQATACPEDASIKARKHPSAVGDYDGDTIPDLMVKFDREELLELVGGQTGDITMTVTGMVSPPGQPFAGFDTVMVIASEGQGDVASGEEEDSSSPSPAPSPTALPPPGATTDYEIRPGDTLTDIAARFGTTVEALVQLNGLKSAQVVWAGQVLQVPATAPPAPAAPPSRPPPAVATVEYTVRPGESVWDVAVFFGTTVETIAALNGLANPGLVVVGQRLLVPEPAAGVGASPPVFTSGYVVQTGETLTDIAARFGTTVEALAAANHLANPSVIHHGYRLLVP